MSTVPFDPLFLALGVGGSLGVLGAALALGIRHGIDWDHIAAITDITSTAVSVREPEEAWLTGEPAVMLTDESHHALATEPIASLGIQSQWSLRTPEPAVVAAGAALAGGTPNSGGAQPAVGRLSGFVAEQKQALFLGTMYALGHASIVTALGLAAILAAGFLPGWIDPIMERVVGVTLILLAVYLFYSIYRFFRGGEEFHIRSRWMLVFAGVRNGFNWLRARLRGEHNHQHVQAVQQYGVKTAYGVGLIHGIGAETGTQVLVIATAVGAGTKVMGIGAMLAFVTGMLVSNSLVTIATTAGFISSRRRQSIYILAGLLAAVFSLAIGLLFLFQTGDILPDLGRYFHWVGGPEG